MISTYPSADSPLRTVWNRVGWSGLSSTSTREEPSAATETAATGTARTALPVERIGIVSFTDEPLRSLGSTSVFAPSTGVTSRYTFPGSTPLVPAVDAMSVTVPSSVTLNSVDSMVAAAPFLMSFASETSTELSTASRAVVTVMTGPATTSPRSALTSSTRNGSDGKNKISLAGTTIPTCRSTSLNSLRARRAESSADRSCCVDKRTSVETPASRSCARATARLPFACRRATAPVR